MRRDDEGLVQRFVVERAYERYWLLHDTEGERPDRLFLHLDGAEATARKLNFESMYGRGAA